MSEISRTLAYVAIEHLVSSKELAKMKSVKTTNEIADKFLIECVTTDVMAMMFRVMPRTIERWRKQHSLPSIKLGKYRLYHMPAIRKWAEGDEIIQAYRTTSRNERMIEGRRA